MSVFSLRSAFALALSFLHSRRWCGTTASRAQRPRGSGRRFGSRLGDVPVRLLLWALVRQRRAHRPTFAESRPNLAGPQIGRIGPTLARFQPNLAGGLTPPSSGHFPGFGPKSATHATASAGIGPNHTEVGSDGPDQRFCVFGKMFLDLRRIGLRTGQLASYFRRPWPKLGPSAGMADRGAMWRAIH